VRPFGEAYFSRLTGAQRLVAFVIVVALSAALLAFLAGGWKTGVPIAFLVLGILWVTRPLWQPASNEGSLKVWLSSLAVISSVALAALGKTPEGRPILHAILEHFGLEAGSPQQITQSDCLITGLVLAFALVGVFIVNWFTRDRSAMQKHPKSLDEDFPEQTYREKLRHYADILVSRLNTLDNETRWDDYFFAPLEAEVQVLSGRRPTRKIVDLMNALKADRSSRIILVLGDPGAGKSIALRKLAKELLREVDRTGRLPVYVSLKEWGGGRHWSEDAPPSAQELRAFILRTLKGSAIFPDEFLGKYFDRMFDRGRFFFILDSFDEIPAVLDVGEESWLVQYLSRLITEFFADQDLGRGVVASRFYRRPKFNTVESATLEIRPFSDLRILEALRRSEKLRPETIDTLFRDRTELIPVARNPFSAALIRIYAENHGGELPSTQLEMYESYIRGRLAASSEQLRRHGLTPDQVIDLATKIAWCMFKAPEIGLEAPVDELAKLLPGLPIEPVTALLGYSNLGRMSGGTIPRFSFVHRRLNEYFVARGLVNDPDKVDLQVIPTDSRYRDALALYCEVGEVSHVRNIAAFCWSEIKNTHSSFPNSLSDRLRAVHCLRFLSDAL
jgi:NACHT domain